MKENLQQGGREKKYGTSARLYSEFTDSFVIPFRRIKRMALEKIRIFEGKIKGGDIK